ncbi:MAG: 5-bromo-4-chloroindolyl phosphate hydrolysis family protein [Anaerolineae bacterium]
MTVRRIKDAFNLLVALGVLLLGVSAFKMHLAIALLLAMLTFVGLFLLLNPQGAEQVAEAEARLEVQASLADSAARVKRIVAAARQVRSAAVTQRLNSIAKLANDILAKLRADPHTLLSTATNLSAVLTQFQAILEQYQEIESGRITADPTKLQALKGTIETEVLPHMEEGLRDFAVRLDADDVAGLEVAIRLLTNTLKLEGLS